MFLNSYFITYEIPYNLAGIDTEWRKTQCMPREVCVDVGKEFGATTNTFFKPPCVSIYRCGGCCNSEGLQCMNISTNYISKTVSCHSSYSPSALCRSIYDHAYFKPFYCYYEKGKKKIPEYTGKTAEETTAWKKMFNTLFPQMYIYKYNFLGKGKIIFKSYDVLFSVLRLSMKRNSILVWVFLFLGFFASIICLPYEANTLSKTTMGFY